MTINLQRFVDRMQGLEARGQQNFTMPMSDAKAMHAELTKLLLDYNELREKSLKTAQEDVITIQMGGGSFK